MPWKHYEPQRSGRCHIDIAGDDTRAKFEMGVVTTGKQRVFFGYYKKVVSPDGVEGTGESPATIRKALHSLGDQLANGGRRLLCAGRHDCFYESGLSFNSGFGYIEGRDGSLHMMDRP